MRTTAVILAIIVLFLLAGVVPSRGDMQAAIFRSPVFISLLAVLCAWTAACMAGRERSARRLPALLAHAGPLVLLCGALGGFLWGRQGTLVLPLTERHPTDAVRLDDGQTASLGFPVSATLFRVDYYPPQYDVYRNGTDLIRRVPVDETPAVDLGEGGWVRVEELKEPGEDRWAEAYTLTNGWVLREVPRTARSFEAQLAFAGTDGARRRESLRVNHPVTHKGWRFYLQSYDSESQRYVVVSARRDPGRGLVVAGIWMMVAGTALVCWRRP